MPGRESVDQIVEAQQRVVAQLQCCDADGEDAGTLWVQIEVAARAAEIEGVHRHDRVFRCEPAYRRCFQVRQMALRITRKKTRSWRGKYSTNGLWRVFCLG